MSEILSKTGKIVSITKGKQGEKGVWYFYLKLEDGFQVSFGSKSDPQTKFKEGETVTFNYQQNTSTKDGKTTTYNNIVFPKPAGFGGAVKPNPKECALNNAVAIQIAYYNKTGELKALATDTIKARFEQLLKLIE